MLTSRALTQDQRSVGIRNAAVADLDDLLHVEDEDPTGVLLRMETIRRAGGNCRHARLVNFD